MNRVGFAAMTLVVIGVAQGTQAQEHAQLSPASGVAHGIPRICADAGVASVASGAWSNPSTWSTRRVPSTGDKVLVTADTRVSYDVVSDARVRCVDVEGVLAFRPDRSTRIAVGTITVLETGLLEVGTVETPIAADAIAEVVILNQPIDTTIDPEQLTGGLVGLGTVRIHGALKTPTFSRVAAEPLTGQTSLRLEQPVSGWRVGDTLVLPDTRQLPQDARGENYVPQWEELTVAAVSGSTITVSTALAHDHRGARDGAGAVEFLPHVGNVSRNVIVRSESPAGTRGHVIFNNRADVDIRYALFKGLGRTQPGVLDNVTYDARGMPRHAGTNQIGRYSLHFHHTFGPTAPQTNGYQFTVIGNAVDDASKWGITVHNSHYGLIQDNVVYNSRGAGIVAEDGTESFNVFEHNFSTRSEGSGDFAPRSGYGGSQADPGGEGVGFWLRGPNNVIRNNVAADVDAVGFGIAAGPLGEVRIPAFKGADPSKDGEFTLVDAAELPLLEFVGNEAYGAIQTGVAVGWNGALSQSRVWHASRYAVTAFPIDRLTIDGLVGRGDTDVLNDVLENPTGIWFGDYASKHVSVRDANIQGFRVGVASPFIHRTTIESGRGDGVATIEDSYFRDYVGVAVATAYARSNSMPWTKKRVIIRNSRFDALSGAAVGQYAPAAISMNYGMAPGGSGAAGARHRL
ncbi:MAG: right-handed parallel beta-helix repeat-containing protein [Acidobacteria bacterium]|nr:right-handed parallel beta-helix repeat-containing protein [Acidobacteriota bacterium]